mgnify:CR=1 FL=1
MILKIFIFFFILLSLPSKFCYVQNKDSSFTEFHENEEDSSDESFFREESTISENNNEKNINLYSIWTINIFIVLFTIITGFISKYKNLIKYRPIFLGISIIYLGFIVGGCPCMISSFQNLILYIVRGDNLIFSYIFWFIILLPLTYIMGKSWCGWVCHLGALQEFLYNKKYGKLFISSSSQIILRYIRIIFTLLLVFQLIIYPMNIWCQICPFKSIFNLNLSQTYYTINVALLITLIVLSIYSYRPFCRSLCPVGLILSLVSILPYALKIKSKECKVCYTCIKECKLGAIKTKNNKLFINNLDCIFCSECIESCSKNEINYTRK